MSQSSAEKPGCGRGTARATPHIPGLPRLKESFGHSGRVESHAKWFSSGHVTLASRGSVSVVADEVGVGFMDPTSLISDRVPVLAFESKVCMDRETQRRQV
jgi:hypothetical protein